MSLASTHDHHERRILTEVEAGTGVSQRSLSRNLGIALGLTNLIVKRLVRKGWLRMIHVKPNRVTYLITPAGIAEKARMSRDYFAATTRFYAETRDSIRLRFAELSTSWPAGGGEKRIAFVGAGEVAEIGFVCLQETDLRLTSVYDDSRSKPFFGLPVRPMVALRDTAWDDGEGFTVLVVMAFVDLPAVESQLMAVGCPPSRVCWLDLGPRACDSPAPADVADGSLVRHA